MKQSIGYTIRKLRESKDLSQENVADELGLTKGAYSKIETGKTNPSASRLMQIARVLEVDVTEFFGEGRVVTKAEDPKAQFGFATKGDVQELANMLHSVTEELNKLKSAIQTLQSQNTPKKKGRA